VGLDYLATGAQLVPAIFFQVRQDLLDDHRVLDAGNDPGCSSTDSAPLNVNIA
jgi:hypothetical protein